MDRLRYIGLGFTKPNRIHPDGGNGLADTRVQVVVMGPDLEMKLGVTREEVMGIKEVSGSSVEAWSGIPIVLSLNPDDIGEMVKSTKKRRFGGIDADDNWLTNKGGRACR